MSNRSITGPWPAPLSVLAGTLLIASPSHAQTQRDLGTHQHGAATLDVVLDGDRLLIDLAGPADNVLGFEHAPTTDAQRATIEDARQALSDGMLLVPDSAADCQLVDADVKMPHDEGHDEGHDEDHDDEHADEHDDEHADEHDDEHADEHDDEHADEHDDEHADEHDDEHADEHDDEHADEHGDEHSDIDVAWTFACASPDALTTIDTTALFERFPDFERIEVQLAGPGGQSSTVLGADAPSIDLDPIR